MEKVIDSKSNTMKKIESCTKENKRNTAYYRIQLICREKRNDARISLPIFEGGANPRITACSAISSEDAIVKLLEKIKVALLKSIEQKYIVADNLFNIFDNISTSLKSLNLQTDMLTSYFHNIVTDIYSYLNKQTIEATKTAVENIIATDSNKLSNINNQEQLEKAVEVEEILTFKDVAIKWFKYKYSFTVSSKDNPKPLSKKTLEGYNKIMNLKLIPFFEEYKSIDDIGNEELQKCIDNTNGGRYKEAVYIVLKMIFDYARDNNYISYFRTIKKPPKAPKKVMLKIEGHELVYIKSARQNHWLDCFEQEGTDVAYLFEAILLAGLRPEEACGLNWTSLLEDTHYFWVKNAFKDFPVYNENAEIIGHTRDYDKLKTDESYRKVPIHPRYREILLKHKEKQKELFKKLNLKWTENTPLFLNRYYKAYIPENLSKALRKFREKYKLEYLTPYGLRHSFATFLSEQGMRDVVLMKLMGHSDFSTTQKYYIFVSDERKKLEYEQAWGLSNVNKHDIDIQKSVTMQVFEQLQSMWLQTLTNVTVA